MVFWKDFFFCFFLKKLHQRRTPGEISGSQLKERFSGRGSFRESATHMKRFHFREILSGEILPGEILPGEILLRGDFATGRFC